MIIINITSFSGITAGERLVYAKYYNTSDESDKEEREYIEEFARKGYYCVVREELEKFPSIRFDNLLQVECEINKLFPNEEKVWYYCGSMKMFEKVKGRL